MRPPTIAIAIPTHNRPEYLREALTSVERQTVRPDEVIIVDDASQPPVNYDDVTAVLSVPARIFRHDTAKGLAWNRNKAVTEANSDFIVPLDDDDRLAPIAIENIARRLAHNPNTDVLFLTLEGFGSRAEHFNRVQPEGTKKALAQVSTRPIDAQCIAIESNFLVPLLKSVPQSFQHPVVHKRFWVEVATLRLKAYATVNGLDDTEAAQALLTGPLRDSEWAIYSAFLAKKVLLLEGGFYQMRCEGQGSVSKPEQRHRQVMQSLNIKRTLVAAAELLQPFRTYRSALRSALRADLFNTAYAQDLGLSKADAFKYLLASATLGPKLVHVKLGIQLLLRQPRHQHDPN